MISQNRADAKRQIVADQQLGNRAGRDKQNQELLDLSRQILELTKQLHAFEARWSAGEAPSAFGIADLTQIVAWRSASRGQNWVAMRRGLPACPMRGLTPRPATNAPPHLVPSGRSRPARDRQVLSARTFIGNDNDS